METEPDWKGVSSNPNGKIIIGENTQIRECVIINKPTKEKTHIGSNCYLMNRSFVGHDTIIGDYVTLYPGTSIAGFVCIGDYTSVGMNASVHQNSKLGRCCMIGANSFFKGDSPDGITWGGVPAKPLKINVVGINKSNLKNEEKMEIILGAKKFINSFQSSSNVK
jgi:UDP-N-acetylglucosamine acyltransferase